MESTVEDPPQKASCPFSECLFQVPANRIGYSVLSLGQLKILQEDHAWSVGLLANLELAEWPSDPPATEATGINFPGGSHRSETARRCPELAGPSRLGATVFASAVAGLFCDCLVESQD